MTEEAFAEPKTGRTVVFGIHNSGVLEKKWWEFIDEPSFLEPKNSHLRVGMASEGNAQYITWHAQFNHSNGLFISDWQEVHRTRIFGYVCEYDEHSTPTRLIVQTGDYLPGLWLAHEPSTIDPLLTAIGYDESQPFMLFKKGTI